VLKKNIFVKGQSLAEVVTFLGIITLAIIAMQIYIQRGIQVKTKDLTKAIINPEHLQLRAYTAEEETSSGKTKFSGTTIVSTVKGGGVTRDITEKTVSTSKSWSKNKP